MQNIVEQTRSKLAPFIGQGTAVPFSVDTFATSPMIYRKKEELHPRMIRKIPRQNYQDLGRLVPISWL